MRNLNFDRDIADSTDLRKHNHYLAITKENDGCLLVYASLTLEVSQSFSKSSSVKIKYAKFKGILIINSIILSIIVQ